MSARLLHYSAKPIRIVRSTDFRVALADSYGLCSDKPRGLWVSVEGEHDWASWCEAESFGGIGSKMVYEVTLAPTANILRITSVADLQRFSRAERAPSPCGGGDGIRWLSLATRYDGIIIAPYQWKCRFSVNWYYGWDCASGCIWNAKAVDGLTLVRNPAELAAV